MVVGFIGLLVLWVLVDDFGIVLFDMFMMFFEVLIGKKGLSCVIG